MLQGTEEIQNCRAGKNLIGWKMENRGHDFPLVERNRSQ